MIILLSDDDYHMMTITHCQDHILTENIWYVWSTTSYSGDKRRCYQMGQMDKKREDRSTQPLDCWKAEFCNVVSKILQVMQKNLAGDAKAKS